MIISVAVFTFNSAAEFAKTYDDKISQTNLQAFNSQFEIYDRDDVTIYDIITLANLAKDINEENGVTQNPKDPYYIKIIIEGEVKSIERMTTTEIYGGTGLIQTKALKEGRTEDGKIDLIKKEFVCKSVTYNNNTKKVNSITFKEK